MKENIVSKLRSDYENVKKRLINSFGIISFKKFKYLVLSAHFCRDERNFDLANFELIKKFYKNNKRIFFCNEEKYIEFLKLSEISNYASGTLKHNSPVWHVGVYFMLWFADMASDFHFSFW